MPRVTVSLGDAQTNDTAAAAAYSIAVEAPDITSTSGEVVASAYGIIPGTGLVVTVPVTGVLDADGSDTVTLYGSGEYQPAADGSVVTYRFSLDSDPASFVRFPLGDDDTTMSQAVADAVATLTELGAPDHQIKQFQTAPRK